MRNHYLIGITLLAAACNGGPGQLQDPPVLQVTSPARSLIQNAAGTITVTGTATPNKEGDAILSVMVNNVAAVVNADGTFSVDVQVKEGATLLHTVALDVNQGQATDTRSVEAGAIHPPGDMIPKAITAAVSKQAFAKIASAAGPIIQGLDMKSMLAPLQPMVHSGDEDGPDCLYGELFINNVTMTNVTLSLVPVAGGLQMSAELDGVDVPGYMKYAVACLGGTDNTDIKATKIVVGGTLDVKADGKGGFTTSLANPTVDITGLDISSGGIPGDILDIVPLDSAIEAIAPVAANLFATPLMNKALGALGGPKTLNLLGKSLTVNVMPSTINFTADSGVVTLDMSMVVGGAESSAGYTYVQNGTPTMNAGMGMQLGLSDDLANDMLSQAVSLKLLDLSMPAQGGTFDTTAMAMTSPPMISDTEGDGKMHMVLPDMTATFELQGTPVGEAAINATVDLAVVPNQTGLGVAIQLGTPDIEVDVLGNIANETRFTNDDLSSAVKLVLDSQITSISALLGDIPLPELDGIQLDNLSIGADSGYVMVQGTLQ